MEALPDLVPDPDSATRSASAHTRSKNSTAPGPQFAAFDGTRYLASNPDVAAYVDANVGDFLGSRSNGAIAHYILYGASEGRSAFTGSGELIRTGYEFDLGG